MSDSDIAKAIEEVGSKKAKKKKFDKTPTGTQGKKLPKDVKAALEEKFGTNLSKVMIHKGGDAGAICKEIKATSFAIGQHVYFHKDSYSKDSKLMAHELTHILNASKGKPPKPKAGEVLFNKK